MKKTIPILFIFILTLTAVLLGGIYYGRYIERRNDYVAHILSLTPTATPPIKNRDNDSLLPEFTEFVHELCGVSVLIPETADISKSSESARIQLQDKTIAELNCADENSLLALLDPATMSTMSAFLPHEKRELIATKSSMLTDSSEYVYITYTREDAERIEIVSILNLWPIVQESIKSDIK